MKRNTIIALMLIAACAALSVHAAEVDDVVKSLLKDGGAVEYAKKAPYGAGIDSLYLGYAEDGTPVVGVAVRETKTYKKVHMVVSLQVEEGKYKVAAAQIPNIAAMRGKSKSKAKDALQDITGRVLANKNEARGLLDGITGATKYYKAIYVSYSLMATKLIEEIEAKPDWERQPVSE